LFCRVVHHKNSTINQSEVSKMFSREGWCCTECFTPKRTRYKGQWLCHAIRW
jgi:hypothetical protein